MEFGPVPAGQALGAILAHSLRPGGHRIAKGQVLGRAEIDALIAAGIAEVVVARPGPSDMVEAEAADRVARALAGPGLAVDLPVNGRVNLRATAPGVLAVDARRVRAMNAVAPVITLATLPPMARVRRGQIVATVKIITYAAPAEAVARVADLGRGALAHRPVRVRDAVLVLTEAGQAERLDDKGLRAVEGRLRVLGIRLAATLRVPHRAPAIAGALRGAAADLLLMLTGAATSDPMDVGPEGLRQAGGRLLRFGIPVDPGNLLFLGRLGRRPVIGLPGCARSPALNGADWVLDRVACGLPIRPADFAAMGVGGLLKDTPLRGAPREPGEAAG